MRGVRNWSWACALVNAFPSGPVTRPASVKPGASLSVALVASSSNSTAAAIEFAVESLRVSDIVICGHSQCGAITAMLSRQPVSDRTPHLRDWLRLTAPVLETLKTNYAHLQEAGERETAAAEENVLFGLDNLHSYSCVQERLMDGSLRLHGWFFKIATAELYAYDPETRQFSPLTGG